MTTLHLRKSIGPECFRGCLLIALAICCFALAPTARADDDDRGNGNTSEGAFALGNLLSTGSNNTANGYAALYTLTTSHGNTATGYAALYSNTTASDNTATGVDALFSNTTGSNNMANGYAALYSNTTASDNTAVGYQALQSNTTGPRNTANGFQALNGNTIGYNNTAVGYQALVNNTTGINNVALGTLAGENLTTGSNNNIDIGSGGIAGESQTIRIGNVQTKTFIAGIHGVTVTGTAVVVNSSGQLGVAPSSQRFKAEIKPMDKASEAILALKPVTFRYKKELDPGGIPQFGLVAEEVEKVNPDLVVRDAEGKVFTVRYEAVNAMLLNEFLKEHRKVEGQDRTVQEQKAAITQLKSAVTKQEATIVQQQKEIEALTTGLQKVSDQLELRKPAPQTVANNQ